MKQYKLLKLDKALEPYVSDIDLRMQRFAETSKKLFGKTGDVSTFANGYLYYGFHRTKTGWVYREWAPGADEMHLIGDFNNWNPASHPMTKINEGGVWELELEGEDALKHGQRVKVRVTRKGNSFDRIPLYIKKVIQNKADSSFCGQIWELEPFKWTDGGYGKLKPGMLCIYEAHIGMAQENERIGTYDEFAENVLPRIKAAGYNTVQLMAIMEHPYYASFGYQVTNFFAPSSWFGEPEGLKRLINKAHEMGLFVFLDLVHSHASGNTNEGLSCFDGTVSQFCHEGERGTHKAWGTKLFNYGKYEVIHFLLSNIKYWQEEFHFDGFRFDGVTSMLYMDHGLGDCFTNYKQYFSLNTDVEAVTYLQLATELIHEVNPKAIAISEDMSGMPGMCLPVRSGGIGFDYRLGMGLPDYWIRTIKECPDDGWNLFEMWYELTTRRPGEKVVGYCESHDQALVGDKTLIFRLADAEMYTGMDRIYHSYAIDRAIALHKLIRFITLCLAGEAYLNFMGNEFGHPEWIDFPREGNGYSYKYARRQWSLSENGYLKYSQLLAFDKDMLTFARRYRLLYKKDARVLWIDNDRKLIAFEEGEMIFVFSFHPTMDTDDFFIPLENDNDYKCIFTSLRPQYGEAACDETIEYHSNGGLHVGVKHLSCFVLRKK